MIFKSLVGMEHKSSDFDDLAAYAREAAGVALDTTQIRTYATAVREGYQKNSAVFSAVGQITQGVKRLPWQVYEVDSEGKREPVKNDFNKVLRRPNPEQSGELFFNELSGTYSIGGEAFVLGLWPEGSPQLGVPPREMHLLRPDRIEILVEADTGRPVGFKHTVNGKPKTYSTDEVLQIKNWHPSNDLRGMPPLMAATDDLFANNSSMRWNRKLIKNSAAPSGAVTLPAESKLNDPEYDKFIKRLRAQKQGEDNAGNLMVLEGGATWSQMGLTPKNMDWIKGIKLTRRQIFAVYNVPPELAGDAEGKTYSNYAEARKALYEEAVLPLADVLAGELSRWVFGGDDSLIILYDRTMLEALKSNETEKWARWVGAAKEGVLTANEARGGLGFKDHDDPVADALLIPVNRLPMADLADTGENSDEL